MTKPDLKKIAAQIVKTAGKPPAPPKGYVPSSAPAGAPRSIRPIPAPPGSTPTVPASGRVQPQGSASIKEMQKAILNFATKASETSTTNLQGKGREEGDQVIDTPNPNFDSTKPESVDNPKKIKSNNHLGGTDPFGNFLVKNYLGNEDPVGKQYLNVDVAGNKNRESNTIDDTSLKGIIDTIKRIGTPGTMGTEKAADGVWETRTNNALKNIYAVAYAMFHAATDMELNINGLSEEKLEQFKKLVPMNFSDLSVAQKPEVSKQLTGLINDMATIFDSFKKFVLKNNKYTKYIEQDKSFVAYKQKPQSGSALLDEKENAVYRANMTSPIPGVKVGNVDVTLADLENITYFKMMMTRAGKNGNDPAELAKTVVEVSKALSGAPAVNQNDPGY